MPPIPRDEQLRQLANKWMFDNRTVKAEADASYMAGYDAAEVVCARELLSALAAPVDAGWQPIETAPKDGRELVVWGFAYGNWRPVVAHYMVGGHCIEDHPPIDSGWYHWRPGRQWSNGEQRFYEAGSFHQLVKPPTHWMPLPSSPVDATKEEPVSRVEGQADAAR